MSRLDEGLLARARRARLVLAGALLAALPVHAQQGLGEIRFPNSGAEAAQAPFLRGALLLHSFEYEDAAEAFQAAQQADPGFALAYWGEALTHAHPIWQEDDPEAARAALARLAPTPEERLARAGSDKERAFLESVEVLFGEGERARRNRAYSERLARMHERWPDDLEVAAFYALSLLGTATSGRDVPTYMRAAAVAEQVLAVAPRHPGALHYAIHSFDDPVHAPLGLRMARLYADVAPEAAHARHMPSHIYVALGMWEDSARSNESAFAAGEARVARKGLGVDEREWHSYWWLHYTYVQQGRWGEARELLAEMRRDAEATGSERTRAHLVRMRSEHLAGGDPRAPAALAIEVDLEGLTVVSAAQVCYVDGLAATAAGDLAGVEAAQARLREALERSDRDAIAAEQLGCCAAPYDAPDSPGRKVAAVMQQALAGCAALVRGELEPALAELRAAAASEDASSADFGPPVVAKPLHELLGEVLLAHGRHDEARAEFAAALARAPGRAASLLGLARAEQAAGRTDAARAAWAELARHWRQADDHPALAEVRAALESASQPPAAR